MQPLICRTFFHTFYLEKIINANKIKLTIITSKISSFFRFLKASRANNVVTIATSFCPAQSPEQPVLSDEFDEDSGSRYTLALS